MKLQTSGVLGTSYAIAKLAPKRRHRFYSWNYGIPSRLLPYSDQLNHHDHHLQTRRYQYINQICIEHEK